MGDHIVKKIVAGLFVATSLVALSACGPTETANTTNTMSAPEAMAGSNMTDAMANGTGNMMDNAGSAAMAGNNATTANGTDPMGGSSGH
jgi:hypothetical protein